MEEKWKSIVGYEGLYEVSNQGRVRSLPRTTHIVAGKREYDVERTGSLLKPQLAKHGYVGVWLYGKERTGNRNGKFRTIHRLVAEAFCEKGPDDCEVNHLNEIKDDNRACNLEWCTHQENSSYGTRGERIGKANFNGKQSVPVYQFTEDGQLVARYPSMAEAERSTGFHKGNIWKQMAGIYRLAYGYKWSRSEVCE